jgi:hypothetical protein
MLRTSSRYSGAQASLPGFLLGRARLQCTAFATVSFAANAGFFLFTVSFFLSSFCRCRDQHGFFFALSTTFFICSLQQIAKIRECARGTPGRAMPRSALFWLLLLGMAFLHGAHGQCSATNIGQQSCPSSRTCYADCLGNNWVCQPLSGLPVCSYFGPSRTCSSNNGVTSTSVSCSCSCQATTTTTTTTLRPQQGGGGGQGGSSGSSSALCAQCPSGWSCTANQQASSTQTGTSATAASTSDQSTIIGCTFAVYAALLLIGLLVKWFQEKSSDAAWTFSENKGMFLAGKLGVLEPVGDLVTKSTKLFSVGRCLLVNHALLGIFYNQATNSYKWDYVRGCWMCCCGTVCCGGCCGLCLKRPCCGICEQDGDNQSAKETSDDPEARMLPAIRLRLATLVARLMIAFALSVVVSDVTLTSGQNDEASQSVQCSSGGSSLTIDRSSAESKSSLDLGSSQTFETGVIISAIDLVGSLAFSFFNEAVSHVAIQAIRQSTALNMTVQSAASLLHLGLGAAWIAIAFLLTQRTELELTAYGVVFLYSLLMSWIILDNAKQLFKWVVGLILVLRFAPNHVAPAKRGVSLEMAHI